ncbi:MAG TPA: hypothetical protein VI864_02785 [Candidatus Bathyarchaeia archaeon]|nr:hypothetical protein [Candidatus Bathyarchaeia archaeon]
MLFKATLAIIEKLMSQCSIDSFSVRSASVSLHENTKDLANSPGEYDILVTEHLWHSQILGVVEVCHNFGVELRLTDDGLLIREKEEV